MNDMQMLANIAGMTAELIESGELVRVVRCKDCVKRGFDDCPVNGWMPNKADSDWFCADGKRREE